jgi:hypothetical protein
MIDGRQMALAPPFSIHSSLKIAVAYLSHAVDFMRLIRVFKAPP